MLPSQTGAAARPATVSRPPPQRLEAVVQPQQQAALRHKQVSAPRTRRGFCFPLLSVSLSRTPKSVTEQRCHSVAFRLFLVRRKKHRIQSSVYLLVSVLKFICSLNAAYFGTCKNWGAVLAVSQRCSRRVAAFPVGLRTITLFSKIAESTQ